MLRELGPGFRLTVAFTVLTGLVYPTVVTGISQILFPLKANGSLLTVNAKVVGSSLIGQKFSRPEYFHSRPSSAGSSYDGTASGGSNLGPTSAKLIRGTTQTDDKNNETVAFDGISLRVVHYCLDNDIPYESSRPLDEFKNAQGGLDDVKLINAFNDENAPLVFWAKVSIPADAVTASSSGLDPHISPANAEIQAARVAKSRNAPLEQVKQLIAESSEGADLGFLGEPRVNVLKLNIALDHRLPVRK
jgi:potassium-transporting ATPase KdpC subunit